MFPFSNKYLVDSGTYLKKNEQETSVLMDFEHSNLCSFDKKAFLANIQFFSVICSGSDSFSATSIFGCFMALQKILLVRFCFVMLVLISIF